MKYKKQTSYGSLQDSIQRLINQKIKSIKINYDAGELIILTYHSIYGLWHEISCCDVGRILANSHDLTSEIYDISGCEIVSADTYETAWNDDNTNNLISLILIIRENASKDFYPSDETQRILRFDWIVTSNGCYSTNIDLFEFVESEDGDDYDFNEMEDAI